MKKAASLFVLLSVMGFAAGDVMAQWAKVQCTFYPNILTVYDGYIFAGSDKGIARSKDGIVWDVVNNGLHGDIAPSPVSSFCSIGNILIAGADYTEGLFSSIDDGNHWIRNQSATTPIEVLSFAVHDNFIFAGSSNTSITRSSDSGKTWINVDSGIASDGFRGSAVTSNPDFVYFGNDAGQMYRSSNDGVMWDMIFQSPTISPIYSLIANDSSLYAQIGDTILRSLNDGNNWDVNYLPFAGNSFIISGNLIFDAGYDGILFSTDNGGHWKTANDGLPANIDINAMAIKDGYLYAGTNASDIDPQGGLWRRPLHEFDGVISQSPQTDISLSPNPTNGIINVRTTQENKQCIMITNIPGETVIELANQQASNFTLDLSKLPPGIYYARFISPNSVIVKKIVRQ